MKKVLAFIPGMMLLALAGIAQSQAEIEKLIFKPSKLDSGYKYDFPQKFEELSIPMKDGVKLNGLLFTTDSSKGLVFYLHGNAGNLGFWGRIAPIFTSQHYDVFIPDYRGYGKSGGTITSESQLYDDMQTLYDAMRSRYAENRTIVLGYSIGTGPAAQLASTNNPRMLILQAPYYGLVDLVQHMVPTIDTNLIRYKFPTYQFLQQTKAPVYIFHGDADKTIYPESSEKLKAFFKKDDELIVLKGVGHSGLTLSQDYMNGLKRILKQ